MFCASFQQTKRFSWVMRDAEQPVFAIVLLLSAFAYLPLKIDSTMNSTSDVQR